MAAFDPSRPPRGGWIRAWRALVVAESLAMVGAAVGLGAWLSSRVETEALAGDTTVPGVQIGGQPVGGYAADALAEHATRVGQAALDRPLTLAAAQTEFATTARELGAVAGDRDAPDIARVVDEALAVGRSGSLWIDLGDRIRARRGAIDFAVGLRFDERVALTRLLDVTPSIETPSLPTRLDLENRRVQPAERGIGVLAFDSLSAVALGLAEGAERIELITQPKAPVDDPLGPIADRLDVAVVLGSFETPYKIVGEDDRVHNLKLGAAAIDGTVLLPGDTFSFNETVGDRNAEAGYRYATGISAGQLVDVLGGGICQVSSTIFGAAFFGGVEIERARPHSRPSSYVDMGLDSTVVYDTIDMRIKNTYDFPVVLHMTVSGGKVRAEVLGPRRPYQVTFERKLLETHPYNTVWRDDARLRAGTQVVAQRGRRGFTVQRKRVRSAGGQPVDEQQWELRYPPTSEIIRRGTNPNGETPEAKPKPPLRDPAPHLRIVQ